MSTNTTGVNALNVNTSAEMEILKGIGADKIREFAPVIFFVAVVVVFGFLGNVVTIMYYGFKAARSNTDVFITGLAVIDAVTCLVMSDEIIELCYTVTFTSKFGCKLMYFTNHTFVSTSVIVLFFIGVDRFRKICHPFSWQFSIKSTKRCIVGVFIFAVAISVRDFVILDIVRVPIENGTLRAFYCTHTNSVDLKPVVTFFQMLDLAIFLLIVSSLIIMYSLIIRNVFMKRKKVRQNELGPESDDQETDTPKCISSEGDISIAGINNTNTDLVGESMSDLSKASFTVSITDTSSRVTPLHKARRENNDFVDGETIEKETDFGCEHAGEMESLHDHTSITEHGFRGKHAHKHTHSKLQIRLKKLKDAKIEKQITLMMVALTVGFIVSFVPYFLVNLAVKLTSKTSENELGAGMQLALRSFILNSAINPYIISLFNSRYRRFVVSNVTKCFRKLSR